MLSSSDEVMDHGVVDTLDSAHQRTSENSTGSVDEAVPETGLVIASAEVACVSGEDADSKLKVEVLGSSKVLVEESKIIAAKEEKHSCIIDVKCGGEFGENWDNDERVCRICHLTSDQSVESSTDLIQLGCGCKDELGIAHGHCAEAWFKLKGNRMCEICGDTAKNITGVGDNRFMDEWNDSRYTGNGASSDTGGACWRGQPFCNFLMACLVIAFVLTWFFRVNMF